MGFLMSRTSDTQEVLWSRDPALKKGKGDDGEAGEILTTREARGRLRSNGPDPDIFTIRALSNREFLSLGAYASSPASLAIAAVELCCIGTVKITQSDGSTTEDSDHIKELLDKHSPPEFISALSQHIIRVTTGPGQKKTS